MLYIQKNIDSQIYLCYKNSEDYYTSKEILQYSAVMLMDSVHLGSILIGRIIVHSREYLCIYSYS